jgi:predicted metal-dependent HD superfamily phosphohydrolase
MKIPTIETMLEPHMATLVGRFRDGFLTDVLRAYREPWRRYHTLDHLQHFLHMWTWAVDHTTQLDCDTELPVIEAILYHDYVYVPGHPSNESMSAIAYMDALRPGIFPSDRTLELMNATRNHWQPVGDDYELGVFLDCDIAGFGRDAETYDASSLQLRRELGHLPGYDRLRAVFLQSVIDAESVFRTPLFRMHFEGRARDNICREMVALKGKA